MTEFEQYLVERGIIALELAAHAGVRYLTVWNAMKGKPISPEQAEQIRQATKEMTSLRYIGSLVTTSPANVSS